MEGVRNEARQRHQMARDILVGRYSGVRDSLHVWIEWRRYRHAEDSWLDGIRSFGSTVSIIELPSVGILGNSHMLMMNDNSDSIVEQVACWLMDASA